jgi:hypothetical protein
MEPISPTATNGTPWGFGVILAACGIALGAAALWGANKGVLGLFHDDGIYAVVAKSLADGTGYRIISLPGDPAQTKYPFLYSYLLSFLWTFAPDFPRNIVFFKAFNSVILVALFFAAVVFYRRYFSDGRIGAVAFGVLLCANPVIFTLTDYVLSDLLVVFLTVLALALCAGPSVGEGFRRRWLSLGLVSGLAYLARSAAAPLAIAGVVSHVSKRRFTEMGLFIGTVLLLAAPWFLWVAWMPQQARGPLVDYYSAYDFAGGGTGWSVERQWTVIAGNARYLAGGFELIYLLRLMPALAPVVYLFSAIGVYYSVRKEPVFIWSFLVSSLALLLVWPFQPSRYSAPLIPLLLLFLFGGIKSAQAWLARVPITAPMSKIVSWLLALPIALLLMLNGIWLSSYLFIADDQTTRGLYGSRAPYSWRGFEETFAWVRQHTPPESVLASAYDPLYFLYTGRKAIRPALHRPASYFYPYGAANPDVGTVAEIKPQLVKLGVRYLIIDPLDGFAEGKATLKLLDEIVDSYGPAAKMVFVSADGKHRIYFLAVD